MALLNSYDDIFERFSIMTTDGGTDFETALSYCTNNAPAELAEQFKKDVIDNRNSSVEYLLKVYKEQTGNGINGETILNAWKPNTPTYIFNDVLKRLNKSPVNAPRIDYTGDFKPQATNNTTEQKEAQESPVLSDSSNFETLSKYITAGVKLIPTKPNEAGNFYQLKKNKGTPQEQIIKIDSLPGLKYWIEHGINRFIFIPKEAGFLCIDIDRNHGDGVDGVKNFYSWLENNGLEKIPMFKNLDGGTFPTYTTTASGGIHLYFKCTSELKTYATIAPGVEIKYNGLNITAGGSVKNGKPYSLHGELNKAPLIPAPLLLRFSKKLNKPEPKPAKLSGHTYQAKKKGEYTTEQLLNFARQDSHGGNHEIIFQMATRLKRAGFLEADTIAIIETTPEHQGRNDKQDTYTCIKSIYQ
jgi:hypothetical protein